MRRSGRTARIIWKALLDASEGRSTAIVLPNSSRARWTFSYLLGFTQPISGTKVMPGLTLVLPGGGVIRCVSEQKQAHEVDYLRDYAEVVLDD